MQRGTAVNTAAELWYQLVQPRVDGFLQPEPAQSQTFKGAAGTCQGSVLCGMSASWFHAPLFPFYCQVLRHILIRGNWTYRWGDHSSSYDHSSALIVNRTRPEMKWSHQPTAFARQKLHQFTIRQIRSLMGQSLSPDLLCGPAAAGGIIPGRCQNRVQRNRPAIGDFGSVMSRSWRAGAASSIQAAM